MRLKLHWQIFIALILGWSVGALTGKEFTLFDFSFYNFNVFISTLFISALKMLVVPLIVSAIIVGIGNIEAKTSLRRMGGITLSYYLATSTIAILIGLLLVNFISPGTVDGQPARALLGLSGMDPAMLKQIEHSKSHNLYSIFLKMFPSNIIKAAVEGQLLGLIMFSFLFGYGIRCLKVGLRKPILTLWQGTFGVLMRITHLIIAFAPIGVFGFMAKISAVTGLEAFIPLSLFFMTVVLSLSLHFFGVLPLILKYVARVSPIKHYQAMAPALMTAFSTSSSSATLPVTMECVEKNAGVSSKISSFVLPLGATVNMDGTALFECVVAMFIAQIYGVEVSFSQQLVLVITALLTSIGVAGIPSASLVAIALILTSMGLPVEAIGVVLTVNHVLDMARTSVNVYSDSCGAVVVSRLYGEKTKLI